MKKLTKKLVSLCLSICLVANILSFVGQVKAADEKWAKYTKNTAYTGTTSEDTNGGITLNSRAAVYYKEAVTVQAGTKISLDVQIPTVVSGQNVQYALGLTTGADSFYNADGSATTTTMVTELTSLGTGNTLTAGGAIRLPGGNRSVKVAATTLTNGRANISTTTYNITYEKQASDSSNSWTMTAKEVKTGGLTVTMNISKNDIGHGVYDNGAYIIVGSMNGVANSIKVSNVTVTQPTPSTPDDSDSKTIEWVKYTGNPTGYTGSFATSEGKATLSAKAAAYVKEKVTVQEGTKISMDVKMPTVVNGGLIQYAFGLASVANTFHNADATATGTTLVTELVSLGTATTMTAGGAIRLPGAARVPNVPAPVTLTNGRTNISATTYNITFEKQATTSNNSWVITAKEDKTNGTVVTMNIPKDKISHDAYKDGAYVIAGAMCGTANTLEVSNVTVTQPEVFNAEWVKYTGNPTGYTGTFATNADEVTLNAKAAAYVKEKVTVQEGTKISMDVKMPTIVSGGLIQYAFGLASVANTFHNADATATGTTLVTELVSLGTATTMTAGGAIRLPGAARVPNVPAPVTLTNGRTNISATTYNITFEKQATTSANSWIITAKEDKTNGTVVTMNIPKDKISHDAYKDGAYIIAGAMCGTANTLEVSNVAVTQPGNTEEPDQPEQPDTPIEPTAYWTKYTGNPTGYTGTFATNEGEVTLTAKAAAYVTQKVAVEEGTKISMDVQIPTVVSGSVLQFAFGLTTAANTFHNADATATGTTLVTEFTSIGTATTMTAGGAIRLAGGNRVPNVPAAVALTNGRDNISTTAYKVTFEKQAATSTNSWVMTAKEDKANGNTVTMNVPSANIGHDAFANGAYIIVGSMCGTANVLKVSNVTVTQSGDEPDDEEGAWKVVGSMTAGGTLTEDATYNGDATFANKVAAYYKQKITVEENTKISFKVQFPVISENEMLHYGFSLTNKAGCFYTSDNSASSLSAEMQSSAVNNWAMVAIASKKIAPSTNRTFLANIGAMAEKRSKSDVFEITMVKINETVGDTNYSWKVVVTNTKTGAKASYKYKSTDVAHDLFSNGAYLSVGVMNGNGYSMKINDFAVGEEIPVQEDPNATWRVVDNLTAGGTLKESAKYNGDATFTNKVAAYYKKKITVEENTQISFRVKFPTLSKKEMLHYGFSLTNKEGCFYTSDNSASSLSAELQSSDVNNWAMAAIASKKIAPLTSRTFLANIGVMAAQRSETDVFEITMTKINKTVGDINYSWEVTVKNMTTSSKSSYKFNSTDIAHDMFDNGAYLSVGVMNGNGYTMKLSDLKVRKVAPAPDTAWEALRGYDDADFTTSTNKKVTLKGGKGGAYRKKAFVLENNASVSLEYEAKSLTKMNSNDFYIMWLDKPSLANGAGDTGSGYALQMRTSADYSSFTLYLREVVGGKMGTDNADASLKLGGGTINVSALNQKVKVEFTRRAQIIEGVQYYGSVTVTVAGQNYKKPITMDDAKRVFGDLDKNLYLMAGNMNNIDNTFEVKNVKIAALPIIQSVSGSWKRVYGYHEGILGAIVNKKNRVELYGSGVAYLANPLLGKSGSLTSLSFTMSGLTNDYHNKFTFAVLNKKSAFIEGDTEKGTGFVVQFRSFDKFSKGYAVYVATVTNGKTGSFEKLDNSIVLGDMSKAKFDIQLTRKSNGSWMIKVSDKTYSKTLSYTLDTCKALKALTPGNIYLSAGNTGMDLNAVIGY